ncbi:MAG: DUF167 domain-containing protein [Candidatus Omnitrophota bacterium]
MRTVKIRVIPKAKINSVEKFADSLKVRVSAAAIDGKANKALIEVLAQHFNIKKSQVRIVSGEKSRDKVIKIS